MRRPQLSLDNSSLVKQNFTNSTLTGYAEIIQSNSSYPLSKRSFLPGIPMRQATANGKAFTTKKLFSRKTMVVINVAASPDTVWGLLTDADNFNSWNSTIIELTGDIVLGGRIQLRSTLAPERTFKLKVKEFKPNERLTWGDAMGTRTYTLTPNSDGGTRFSMTEKIGGPIFPLFARMIPPFDESFNQFAADLKGAAEEKE